ncbi:MAG TPA: hypothetical protein VK469_21035, partial [Candidatus Kapabacteria bacterium]|nr:hypothetical protein [Candidatus Kapabacteria bacterium]
RDHNVVIGVLSELSEQITSRGFTRNMGFDEVLNILITAACNTDSWITRRGGIKILGNSQHFNKEVAQVFFEACRDIDEVYIEAHGAVGKFKRFDEESLAILTDAIGHSSVSVAYHAALLLGELGVSRSEELGAEGRRQVAEALLHLLEIPAVEQTVYDFSENPEGQRIGLLYDVLYDSLVRVIAGPDAKEMIKEDW